MGIKMKMKLETKGTRPGPFLAVALALGVLLSLWPAQTSAEGGRAWVLLCSDSSVWKDLRRKDAARLFLGRTDTVAGARAEPINFEPLDERLAFLSALTHLPPTLVERHFLEMRFRGEGDWPRAVESQAELFALLRKNPSRIGWLPVGVLEAMDSRSLEGIRLLTLDGRDRQAGEYALRAR